MRGRTGLRAAWAATLSLLLPGLGQIYARAWWLGLVLVAVDEAISVAGRIGTMVAAPTLPAMAVVGCLIGASLLLMVGASIDAARRIVKAASVKRDGMVTVSLPPRWFRSTWFAGSLVVALGLITDAVLPFAWRTFDIPSASMVPTLMVGDDLVADARPHLAVRRGDVIIFTRPQPWPGEDAPAPAAPGAAYVKRVIGLAGDRVAVKDNQVILNGQALPRQEAGEMVIPQEMSFGTKVRRWTETLPGGPAYAIVTHLAGHAPDQRERTVPPGQLFVMGDNRDNSLDSRFAAFGTVPVDHVIGQAGTLYWSRERERILTPVR